MNHTDLHDRISELHHTFLPDGPVRGRATLAALLAVIEGLRSEKRHPEIVALMVDFKYTVSETEWRIWLTDDDLTLVLSRQVRNSADLERVLQLLIWYGQALKNTWKLEQAINVLTLAETIEEDRMMPAVNHLLHEILGLLAACRKSLWISHSRDGSEHAGITLHDAIRSYGEVWERSLEEGKPAWWHGVNYGALLLASGKPTNSQLAPGVFDAVLGALPNEQDPWARATALECYLGRGASPTDIQPFVDYWLASKPDAFQRQSFRDQLQNVWQWCAHLHPWLSPTVEYLLAQKW